MDAERPRPALQKLMDNPWLLLALLSAHLYLVRRYGMKEDGR